ncbi:PP2C family protein-serine/threonine phosphatase [Paenibacillus sp. GCM10027626]|uniref:PP2C family protein-serine/threonine phosphatase n=1 Tax=Paenibacillus sp. GCM10027626 TaxID=3273411 RepID=UPI00363C2866
MSIIIVDDNTANQLVVKAILNKAGYTDLIFASSAQKLFDILGVHSRIVKVRDAELILMDLMMPAVDGLEACKILQADDRFKDIPIIFVTAVGDSSKMAEALDAGASDYVMKPINRMELLARIRSALRLKKEIDWHKERDTRMKNKLELAKQVQRSVLSKAIDDENIEISAVYQPSSELAGDFYGWYQIDRHRYGVILLDMMGHGISASLVCMYISSILRDTITRMSDMEQAVLELNRYMNQLHMEDELINYYFTAIYMVIDTMEKTFEYVNAGHPAGIAYADDRIELLEHSCGAIGLFNTLNVKKKRLHYKKELNIILYTDGLTDAIEHGSEIAAEHLVTLLDNKKGLEPAEIIQQMLPECNSTNQKDDICLVKVRSK